MVSDDEFISAWKRFGSPTAVSKALGLEIRGVYARRNHIEARHGIVLETLATDKGGRPKRIVPKIGARAISENVVGTVIVASDLHAWPGDRSVSFAALIELIKELKPAMVVANGDSLDGAAISRHPPIGWQNTPTVQEELDAARELHSEIEAVAPEGIPLVWTYGNHCLRFNSRLAAEAPEFKGVFGTSLEDHFPAWDFAMSLHLNGHTVIKHQYHNGQHAGYNNVLRSGRHMVTGHTHRLQATMFADYDGLRWGIECGTLSDFGPDHEKHLYTLDNPVCWSQGFVVLTYASNGMLLEPEFCRVLNGTAWFRGQAVSSRDGAILPKKSKKKAA